MFSLVLSDLCDLVPRGSRLAWYSPQVSQLAAPAILSDELQGLPYKERIDLVVGAINGLGPRADEEVPFEGDPAFAAKVDAWVEQTGATPNHATLFRALEELRTPGLEVERLLEGGRPRDGQLREDDSPKGRWLAELARRLKAPQ